MVRHLLVLMLVAVVKNKSSLLSGSFYFTQKSLTVSN